MCIRDRIKTPENPIKTADHLHTPTFSPNKGPDRAATTMGATKTITKIFTKGRSASAAKKVKDEIIISTVLKKCHPGIGVLKLLTPYLIAPIAPSIINENPPLRNVIWATENLYSKIFAITSKTDIKKTAKSMHRTAVYLSLIHI